MSSFTTPAASSSSSRQQEAVRLAIYDLSQGMAHTLSTQFLGAQHAVDIIPHTAILAYGKEYYFGMGIQFCSPDEFRTSHGMHPIEIQFLGYTSHSKEQFERWCREQMTINGKFHASAYDFFYKNCNNFSEEAARNGLGLSVGVPLYILEMPHKFLSSPMGQMLRPILEQMQVRGNDTATTTITTPTTTTTSALSTMMPSSSRSSLAATTTNPWANIIIPANTTSTHRQPCDVESNTRIQVPSGTDDQKSPTLATPLLDKQTSLLSKDAKIVNICVKRLENALHDDEEKDKYEIIHRVLLQLSDTNANSSMWTHEEIQMVHTTLCNIILCNRWEEDSKGSMSYALMLLRLVVLKHAPCSEIQTISTDYESNTSITTPNVLSRTVQLMAKLVHDKGGISEANRAMAWCVLSNSLGSSAASDWCVDAHLDPAGVSNNNIGAGGEYSFDQIVDRALEDCDPLNEISSNTSLRQSAVAFLYNSSRYLTINYSSSAGVDGSASCDELNKVRELPECMVSILLGCLDHLHNENDTTVIQRLYMIVGQFLISHEYGTMAANLLNDLGLMDEEVMQRGRERGGKVVDGLVNEVAALLRKGN